MTGRFIVIKAEQQGNNTISMRLPLNHALPRRYEAQISFGKTEQKRDALFTKSESFPYYAKSGEYWINAKTRKDAEERIIAAAAEKLVKAISPEQPQSPPSVKLAKAEPNQPPPVMVEPKKSFLKMSADKEIIDESVVDADLKFTGVLILLPEGNRATEKYKQDVEAISREFKRQGIKVFTTAVPYGMADEIKDIIIKVQTTAVPFDVIYQMTSLVWETNSIAPRIFIAEKLGEPYREVTQAQRRESKSKIVQEFASPELCSEGRLIAVRTEQYQSGASYANNQQLASIKMRLPLNHVLPQDYEAQISFMPLGEGKYRPEMKEVSFPYWANGGEAWNNDKTKKDAEDKLNAAIVARLVKGNK